MVTIEPADQLRSEAKLPERTQEGEAVLRLQEAIAGVHPREHREILVLRYLEGMNSQEIAERLSIPYSVVESRVHHASVHLKQLLQPEKGLTGPGDAVERAREQTVRHAIEVLGSDVDAMRWMGIPIRALGFATPVSLLLSVKGCQQVNTVLGRLEYGVL